MSDAVEADARNEPASGRPMRILFCTLEYAPRAAGGAERQAYLQAEELARRGHRVEIVCPRRGDEGSGTVGGARVHRLRFVSRRPFQTVTVALTLGWFLIRHARRFDVIHLHIADLRTDVAAAICRPLGRPVYVKLAAGGPDGDVGRMRGKARWTRHVGLRHAACLQAISAEIAADLARLGIPPERIARIPNGLDTAGFVPAQTAERSELRAALGLPADRPIVLYMGRFARYKGVAELLAAWPHVAAAVPAAELVLVGSVAADDPFDVRSAAAALTGVTIREWSARPAYLLRAADVFVLPSHQEGMSNALLEAMACGLAVVATTVGAAPEMIESGANGWLVPPHDVPALGAALIAALADPVARARMGEAARATVAARYSIGAVVDSIQGRYARLR